MSPIPLCSVLGTFAAVLIFIFIIPAPLQDGEMLAVLLVACTIFGAFVGDTIRALQEHIKA